METPELIERIERDLMDLASEFSPEHFTDAVNDAEAELGWSMPQVDIFKLKWLKERTKRHLFANYRAGMIASDQQINQVHLEQPFKHFTILIEELDQAFNKELEENMALFAGVDATQLFGTRISAGFVYNAAGEDVTKYPKTRINPPNTSKVRG